MRERPTGTDENALGSSWRLPRGAGLTVTAGLSLTVLILLSFWPAVNGTYVYDDELYITGNRHLRQESTGDALRWAFSSFYAANWHPLTWVSHLTDLRLFDLDPRMPHLENLALHAVNAVLLFVVLRAMTGSLWRSCLVAALFAGHPLRVETVAWISQRKELLATLLMTLGMIGYWRYAKKPGVARLGAVTVAYGLGLMAKPTVITFPFLLLLADAWPLGRWRRPGSGQGWGRRFFGANARLLLEKCPLLALAAVSAALTFLAQRAGEAVSTLAEVPAKTRLANATVSYGTYLFKTLWPVNLAVFYPPSAESTLPWKVAGAGFLLILATSLAVGQARRRPFLAVGWLWYLGMLVPMVGFVQVGSQALADRYTYVPLVGVFIALTWGLGGLPVAARLPGTARGVAAGLALALLMAMSRAQTAFWRDNVTLFTHAVSVTRNNWLAEANLGYAYDQAGNPKAAKEHLSKALAISPSFTEVNNVLGNVLVKEGDLDGAAAAYREAIRGNAGLPEPHQNLGWVCLDKGRTAEAVEHFSAALRIRPDLALAHHGLGVALLRQGDLEGAARHLVEALRLNPASGEAHAEMGDLLLVRGRRAEAAAHFREALRLWPGYARARRSLEGLAGSSGPGERLE